MADRFERHPNKNDNGEDTVKYYQQFINLQPRESLALMGVHTIGHFNRMTSHNNYGWSNGLSVRLDLWSNEYYRNMAQLPQKTYPAEANGGKCNDGRVPMSRTYQLQSTFARMVWPPPDPWCEAGRPGEIMWLLTIDNGTSAGTRKTTHSKMLSADVGYMW